MDELELIRRCAVREKSAWDEFVETFSGLIYTYIYNVLRREGSSEQRACAEEIFHDFLVSLADNNCKKLRSFKGKNGCSLASWLRQAAINFTIDHLRKLRPVISVDEEDEEGLALKDILPDHSEAAPDTLIQKERLESLEDCIRLLAKDDKFFLELYLNKEVELDRIAKLLRLSRSATDVRKTRIIQKLRDCFKGKGFFIS